MSTSNDDNLRALIKEDPHFAIRSGTTIMAFIAISALLLSLNIQVSNHITEPLNFDLNVVEQAGESFVQAHLILSPDETIDSGTPCTVRLNGTFGSHQLSTSIERVEQGQAVVLLPANLTSDQQQAFTLDCQTDALIEIENGQISLFQKWFNSLFSSFKT